MPAITWSDAFRIPGLATGTLQVVTGGYCRRYSILALEREEKLVHLTHPFGTLTIPTSWPLQRTARGAIAVLFPPGMPEGFLLLVPEGHECSARPCAIDPELLCYEIDDLP